MTTKAKIKNLIRGLAIIAFAVCLLLSRTTAFTDLPLIRIGICTIMVLFFAEQLVDKNFVGMSIPLGVMACLFRDELSLGDVHYAIIMIAFILIGAGLTVIFGKKTIINTFKEGHSRTINSEGNAEYWEQDGEFDIDNSLGSKTQYLTINNLRKGSIDNALGQLTVYFNGSTVDPAGAHLDIDNGMGALSIYFPKEFRVAFKCDNGMGKINVHGECSHDENQPLINAYVDNGMGTIDFYFE